MAETIDAEREIDELFARDPGEFTAMRDALAKRLRDAGDNERATRVKGLRKPTVDAWAMNQLPRRHREEVHELVEAGEALRQAQRRAASGSKDSGFRDAAERRRQAVQHLTRLAIEVLSDAGRGGDQEGIARSLEAASIDPDAGARLVRGRLSKPVEGSTGFEAIGGLGLVPSDDAGDDAEAERDTERREQEAARRRADEAEADARRAAIRVENLEGQVRDATERLRKAREKLEELERAAAEARESADRD